MQYCPLSQANIRGVQFWYRSSMFVPNCSNLFTSSALSSMIAVLSGDVSFTVEYLSPRQTLEDFRGDVTRCLCRLRFPRLLDFPLENFEVTWEGFFERDVLLLPFWLVCRAVHTSSTSATSPRFNFPDRPFSMVFLESSLRDFACLIFCALSFFASCAISAGCLFARILFIKGMRGKFSAQLFSFMVSPVMDDF